MDLPRCQAREQDRKHMNGGQRGCGWQSLAGQGNGMGNTVDVFPWIIVIR